jgi:hypothetical protein
MKMNSAIKIGYSLIPQGVWFSTSPISGTTARLTPKLKANLSMSPKFSLRGNKAANMVYPGKNNTTGKPRIIRKTLFGRKVTTIKSATVRELMR